MGGAVERSGKSGQANDLAEGAGETGPLKPNGNFERRPHLAGMRKRTVPICSYCDKYGADSMMPAHDASPRCESGKRPHCTCDTCF